MASTPKLPEQQQLWSANPLMLLAKPFQLLPNCSMGATEYENTMARLVIAVTVLLYYKFPLQKYWMYGMAAVGFMYLFGPAVRAAKESFSSFYEANIAAVESKSDAIKDLIGPPKQAKPVLPIPALEEDMKTRAEAIGQEMADRRQEANKANVQNSLYDRHQVAQQLVTNVREFDTVRGAITPTEDEQIFGSRPSVRDSKDGYRTMFSEGSNSVMKFVTSLM